MRQFFGAGRSATPAALALMCILSPTGAFAHSVAGNRVFPATLAIDDPGVSDELALPTFTYLPTNPDGVGEYDFSFEFDKRITPRFRHRGERGLHASQPRWIGLPEPRARGQIPSLCQSRARVHGVDRSRYRGRRHGGDTRRRRSLLDAHADRLCRQGPGRSAQDVEPAAAVRDHGPVRLRDPDRLAHDDRVHRSASRRTGLRHPGQCQHLRLGFHAAVQPPLHERQCAGGRWSRDPQAPRPDRRSGIRNPGREHDDRAAGDDGTVQPGVIYMADTYQIALEAVVPINGASGHNVGVVAELHFFLDDIFPTSIGKPLFP